MISIFLNFPLLFFAGAALFGLLIGSFLNVVIHRLPARLEHEWRCQCIQLLRITDKDERETPPGIVSPPSNCPSCGHRIRPWENIPVLSFFILRGKCSSCQTKISIRYPVFELFTATLFLIVAVHFGPTVQTLAGFLLTASLVALSGIDLDHQLLPDNITIPLLWAGLVLSLFSTFSNPSAAILGAFIGYGVLWLVFQLFKLATGKEGMGYGDFKLMAALGAWFGWQSLPILILLSSAVGAVVGVFMLATGRHGAGNPLPFGPFIALSGFIYLCWGSDIANAYFRFAGLG